MQHAFKWRKNRFNMDYGHNRYDPKPSLLRRTLETTAVLAFMTMVTAVGVHDLYRSTQYRQARTPVAQTVQRARIDSTYANTPTTPKPIYSTTTEVSQ